MNTTISTLCSIVIACGVGASTAIAAPNEGNAAKAPAGTKIVAAAPKPGYEPPLRGKPKASRSGGTRGAGDMPTLEVLAPDRTGLTGKAQPSLQWYVANAGTARMEVTLITEAADEPLLEVEVDPVAGAGVQALHLAEHGINLEPGVEYRWFVAIIPDPDARSKDIVAGGTIRYVEDPAV